MSKKETHPIPAAELDGTNLAGRAILAVDGGYHVGEWCPTPDGTGDPTQVHVTFNVSALPAPLVVRFKSAGELDRFIAILARHRLGVWPKRPE